MASEQKMKIVTIATGLVAAAVAVLVVANTGRSEPRCDRNPLNGEWYHCTGFAPSVDNLLNCQLKRDLTGAGNLQCRQD